MEDVSGGTRIHRCVPQKQNQGTSIQQPSVVRQNEVADDGVDQAQIIKAFYSKSGYCEHQAPCSFNTGYENSGEIKYCDMQTCVNDGHEYTKGGLYPQARSLSNDSSSVELFESPDVSPINWPTKFRTANGTEVVIPAGAHIRQGLIRMRITDQAAWDNYIEAKIAAQANMNEDEYWEDQVAPAEDELLALVSFERTTVAEQL